MALDQLPPQPSSARLQAAQFPNNTDPTRASRHLPLDVVHSIFAFYHLKAADVPNVLLSDRAQARNYHRNISRFAGVSRIWRTVSYRHLAYVVHDMDMTSTDLRIGSLRLRDILLFCTRGPVRCVKQLSYKSVWGSMVDLPTLALVVDAVKSTLTSFMLDLRAYDDEVDEYDINVNRMRSLSQSLGGVEKLEELDMRVKVSMPVAVYVNLMQGVHFLRKCQLDLHSPAIALAVGESETETWRTFPQSRTPWHQLTTLTISNTNLSLTLGAIILTSETIRDLHIDGSYLSEEEGSPAVFQEFLSAIEAHCTSLKSLSCTFRGCDGDSEIPTLDHLLPFLTSCTHLTIGAADLKTIAPLLSLTKLESLKIEEVFLDGPSDSGLRIGHLLKFLRRHKGVLKYFEIDYMEDDGERSREGRTFNRLIEEAAGRNIEFVADLVG